MGAGSSKPADSHVWKAPGPVGVSQDVVESLQTNRESDISRSQSLELAVQARVAAELKKLQAKENEALKAAREKATEITDAEDKAAQSQNNRDAVSKEVETLRARLEKRKQIKELPDSVEKTRSEVVRCLIENDRRPLNCWKEVEAFKEEVRRLEKGWVDKVTQ
ncbi:MICOS complex subunit MIC19 [Microdochium nivale]|nr:MICOS complex subunit MIC19 [Microdochium nivale]